MLWTPPSLSEWLPEDHLVWSVLGAVEQMDLRRFRDAYRLGAAGRAPYDPAMLVALLLYSYARGNRSSRGIERACREDVTYKLITAMRVPDHSTIAEFRRRHERELGELFTKVLALCDEAGLVEVGVISIDGMKIRANASRGANRSYEKPGWHKGPYEFMRRVLSSEAGHELYKHRKATSVRPEQVQPRVPPIPATRQSSCALGVAPAGGSSQPT